MYTSYDDIFSRFIFKVKTYEWANLSEDEIRNIFDSYLNSAISNFHTKQNRLSERDEIGFLCKLTNTEIEILIDYMIIEWLDSEHILTPMALKSRLTSKDFQSWSPSNHLDKLLNLKKDLISEVNRKCNIDSFGFSENSYSKSFIEKYKKR